MSNGNGFDCILFDLDGTLVDTEPSAAKVVDRCYAEWGIRLQATDATHVTGRTWEAALQYLFDKYPPPMDRGEATRRILDSYRQELDRELIVVPGSVPAVRELARESSLALVSGSRRAEIQWVLEKLRLRDCFHVVLGAEDYPRSKPAPDGFLKALQLLDARPERSLVFEDSAAGVASAVAAGLWVVAVTSTNHHQQDTSLAHRHIPDLQVVSPQWCRTIAKELGLS